MKNNEQEYGLIEINVNEVLNNIPNHGKMVEIIKTNLPEIQRATSIFYKTQSQYMDNILTVSHPTPLRNIRQILSEITRSKEALQEAYFKNKKKAIEIKILQRDIKKTKDKLNKELLCVDLEQKMAELESSKSYIAGAVRKVTNHILQYKSILKELKITSFDELDFEKEEEQYHIKKAFDQAITAARARNGIVDEGNHIYFSQIGINGAAAQVEIIRFLDYEGKLITSGKEVGYDLVTTFLEEMYQKFKGSSAKILKSKLMQEKTEISMLTHSKDT
jgi:phosphopantetheinyl transferase (holo-ACP synthase)